jgi:hypothetical protein
VAEELPRGAARKLRPIEQAEKHNKASCLASTVRSFTSHRRSRSRWPKEVHVLLRYSFQHRSTRTQEHILRHTCHVLFMLHMNYIWYAQAYTFLRAEMTPRIIS